MILAACGGRDNGEKDAEGRGGEWEVGGGEGGQEGGGMERGDGNGAGGIETDRGNLEGGNWEGEMGREAIGTGRGWQWR